MRRPDKNIIHFQDRNKIKILTKSYYICEYTIEREQRVTEDKQAIIITMTEICKTSTGCVVDKLSSCPNISITHLANKNLQMSYSDSDGNYNYNITSNINYVYVLYFI